MPGDPKICIERVKVVKDDGLAPLPARPKVEILKLHVEIHRSFRNCNEVTRKMLTRRSQLLNTLGRKYRERVDRKSTANVRGPMPEASSMLLMKSHMTEY
jgi:hypothetical protein